MGALVIGSGRDGATRVQYLADSTQSTTESMPIGRSPSRDERVIDLAAMASPQPPPPLHCRPARREKTPTTPSSPLTATGQLLCQIYIFSNGSRKKKNKQIKKNESESASQHRASDRPSTGEEHCSLLSERLPVNDLFVRRNFGAGVCV